MVVHQGHGFILRGLQKYMLQMVKGFMMNTTFQSLIESCLNEESITIRITKDEAEVTILPSLALKESWPFFRILTLCFSPHISVACLCGP